MGRVGFRGRLTPGRRRATDWELGFQGTGATTIVAGTKVLLASLADPSVHGPGTIVRSRGYFGILTDQSAASEDQIGAVGMTLVSNQALTAGAAAIPGPSTDALWDGWFWWQSFAQRMRVATAVGEFRGQVYQIDSKAMRKLETGQALVLMVENASATNAFQISIDIRILVKAA